ncbi:MAG: TraX family protein [Turicibacter sp.]
MKIFDSFTLKIIAIFTMLLDHIYTYVGGDIPIWFGYLGKLAAPIFFYLIVEGFFHTRSKEKYLMRLASFAVLMVGVDVVMGITNNVFASLALCILLLMMIEKVFVADNLLRRILLILACMGIGIAALFTEASVYGVMMTLIFYFFRDKKGWLAVVYIMFSLSPVFGVLGVPGMYEQLFLYDYQWMMVFALPLILLYNGKLGLKNTFTKWMFYVFYPAHLIIVVTIGHLLAQR